MVLKMAGGIDLGKRKRGSPTSPIDKSSEETISETSDGGGRS